MNDIVHTLYNATQYILGFGPTVILPLVLFILVLFFKVRPTKTLRSSLTVGISFVGIYIISDTPTNNVGPAAQAVVERTGINLSVVDLGWPPLSAITWGPPIAPLVIPLAILINVVMLALNRTRIIDVDMQNYWYSVPAGTLVYYSTGSLFSDLLVVVIAAVVVLKFTDWSVLLVQKYFSLEGISLPTLSSVVFFPVGLLVDKAIDRTPGFNRIYIDLETVQKKLGIFGEPMMAGTVLGTLLDVIAGYDFRKVLLPGISIGGMMFILPCMVCILMEGLLPLSEATKKYLDAKYPDRDDLYIGLNITVAVGNPTIISTALLLTSISVSITSVLPGNEILSFGDLAGLAVVASVTALASRGNIFRTALVAIPVIIADLWIATKTTPSITGMVKDVNFESTEGSSGQVSNSLDGGSPFRFRLLKTFNGDIIAIGLVSIIALVLYDIFRATRSTVYV